MEDQLDKQFSSSQLGTQEHWDETYRRELEAFVDMGDIGYVWFGEDAQERMVRWVTEDSDLPVTAKILDLGCGNGALLMALREDGYTNLVGVDYSKLSIELAKRIAEKEKATDVTFQTCNILSPSEIKDHEEQYDLCLDKGTYDAIGLKNTNDPTDRLSYIRSVHKMLSIGGRLLITSCNWTQSELEKEFSTDFEIVGEIAAPSFSFGGKTGQSVTTLIMKKKVKAS